MKIWKNESPFPIGNPLIEEILTESAILADIETTGLSREHAQVYLIGCAARKKETLCITQFFGEQLQEEPQILAAFLKFLSPYDTIVTYNGMRFDIPFLQGRCAHYQIEERLDSYGHSDLLRQMSKFKNILKLPDMKQKTLENFMGIHREDPYSGKDLIHIYMEYAKHINDNAGHTQNTQNRTEYASILKLHNYEDILGMADLLPALAYHRLFEGNFRISSQRQNIYKAYDKTPALEWILSLDLDYPLPVRFSFRKDPVCLTGFGKTAKLSVQAYKGELKYFYPNYKDYYYLPAEDAALHKSIASYVDKNHRVQATAATCYTRKQSCFLPQYQELFHPCFCTSPQDRHSYFELTGQFQGSPESWNKYALHLLQWLPKKTEAP